MAYVYSFEKLTAWQMSRQFAEALYSKNKNFPKEALFGITSQIRRAAISISCNLAEGSARFGDREKKRYYEIAYGRPVEVVKLLIICCDLEYLLHEQYTDLRQEVENLTFQINRLVQSYSQNKEDIHEPDIQYSDTPY